MMNVFSGFSKLNTTNYPIILENIPFFWYFDNKGLYHSYKQDGQVSPSFMGAGPTVSVLPIRKMYI
jgi:hypothetical protein